LRKIYEKGGRGKVRKSEERKQEESKVKGGR
jgi:hypothetical protein